MDFVTDRTVRFIQDLDRVESFDGLSMFVETTLASLNIDFFSFYEPDKTVGTEIKGVHFHNLPPAWLQHYLEMGYDAVSPVLRKIILIKSPFFWDTLEPEGYLDSKDSRRMMSESGEFGLHDGFSSPILHTNGDMVIFNLATEQLEDDPRLPPAIQLISLHLHEKYKELRGLDKATPGPKLSKQERECLSWVAAGKTAWEIGEMLSISEASVCTYLKRAKHKLGVTTRAQAIVAAIRRRLIRV